MKRAAMWVGVCAVLGLAGCLASKDESPSCTGGDALRFDGGWYCVYTGAIIIEGFLCPEAMPHQFMFEGESMGFGVGSGQLGLCSPSETPPDGGWAGLFEEWRRGGGMPGPGHDTVGGDTDASDTAAEDTSGPLEDVFEPDTADGTATLEVVELDASADSWGRQCLEGIGQSACWGDEQCPESWTCAGGTVGCTACDGCDGATLGECFTSLDALGLLWRDGKRVALWAVSQVYTLIPCPALTLETATSAEGPWSVGTPESACSGVVAPPYASSLVRDLPVVDKTLWTRVRGTLKTGCFSPDPAECQGELELVSPALAPAP